jgi:peptidoglycan hydrolase-like protein with peptidoglycan-binding domain
VSRRGLGAVTAGAVVLAAVGGSAAGLAALRGRPAAAAPAAGPATALATVAVRALSETDQQDATLGYAGSYSVLSGSAGVLTALPSVGAVIRPGHALYSVDGAPVVLLRGSVPMWRPLGPGVSGVDVRQLNANLVALGYASALPADTYGSATAAAVRKLQTALGQPVTGTVAPGQVVFLPTAARITAVPVSLGAAPAPGTAVLSASSTTRTVTIDLDAADQSSFRAGRPVTITMPDGSTTPGVVTAVSPVAVAPASDGGGGGGGGGDGAGGGGDPTVTVTITPRQPAATGTLDQAAVTVTITTRVVPRALTVPVTALLAQAGGGYAVEVDSGGSRRVLPVRLGMFDESAGLVQVSGAGLAAGQHVVVPSS